MRPGGVSAGSGRGLGGQRKRDSCRLFRSRKMGRSSGRTGCRRVQGNHAAIAGVVSIATRDAQCALLAALRIACDLVSEGLIDERTALERLGKYDLDSIYSVSLSKPDDLQPLCRGTPASSGAAAGPIALTPEAAQEMADNERRNAHRD